jgi:hypothetical protein
MELALRQRTEHGADPIEHVLAVEKTIIYPS